MTAIFYDLETTDKCVLGQILNYCFILVDENFALMKELSGRIRISRTQLPSPEAILANRTNVLLHQELATQDEREAMRSIADFIETICASTRAKVPLIGFNSNRFDLTYLRTSLLRNGISPYFGGRTINRDLLFCAQKLSVTHKDFPRIQGKVEPERGPRLSLRLESLSQHFQILSGAQQHESRADVLLTIALAKLFKERFGIDVRTFEAYEGLRHHHSQREGVVFYSYRPQYDLQVQERFEAIPITLLEGNDRGALWIDLKAYREGKGTDSIRWYSPLKSAFFIDPSALESTEWRPVALDALAKFSKVTLVNYFSSSSATCDVEADIYRIDFDGIDILREAIWERNPARLKQRQSEDLQTIYDRHRLVHYDWGNGKDDRVETMLREYALHRYGGRMVISKQWPGAEENIAGSACATHPTFLALTETISTLIAAASKEDAMLLDALRRFYYGSDLYRVAGIALERVGSADEAALEVDYH